MTSTKQFSLIATLILTLSLCATTIQAQDGTCNAVTKVSLQPGLSMITSGNPNITGGTERITNGNFSAAADGYIWPASDQFTGNLAGWTAAGGSNFTYGQVLVGAYGISGASNKVYFGNAFSGGPTGWSGVTWDANNIATNVTVASFTNCDTGSYGVQEVMLSQTIATTVGKTYRLSFSSSPETGPTGRPEGLYGLGITGYTTITVHYGNGWIPWAYEFVATSASTTITFTNPAHIADSCAFGGVYSSELELAEVSVKSCAAVAATPTLGVVKSNPAPALAVGTNSTYSITVSNPGTGSATGATVKDAIPSGMTLVSTSGTNWSCAPASGASPVGTITCTYSAAIAAGASSSVLSVVVNPTASLAGTTVTNYVSTDPTGGAAPPVATTCTTANTPTAGCGAPVVSAIPNIPDLTIAKSHAGSFTAGGTGTYSLTVSNIGGAASSGGITVTDNLPVGLSVNGGAAGAVVTSGTNAANWTCNSNAASPQTITCTSATAIAATTGTRVFGFTVNIAGAASGTLTNNVSVAGGGESNVTNNTASDPTVITAIGGTPTVVLVKSCTTPATCTTAVQPPGTDLVFNIAFTNSGSGNGLSLILIDNVPTNTDFKLGSATASPGTTGLTFTIEYSNDNGATWTYTPVSGGGGAIAGYDRNVKVVRWQAAGNLSQTAPNNTGSVNFTARIR